MKKNKSEGNRNNRFTVRFTPQEALSLKEWAEVTGHCIAFFIRQRTLGFIIKPRLTKEETIFYRQLTGMANNLNQLAKAANSREDVWNQIRLTIKAIDQLHEKLI
jgi:hypothetical protein